jgi:2-keto-4-pentenoate hydratase
LISTYRNTNCGRGIETAHTSEPEAPTGNIVGIVRHVADLLGAFGERLAAGDVIITGSVVPPLVVQPDEDDIAFDLEPVGSVSVSFSR